MTPIQIKTHLINRYLNGYSVSDHKYEEILDHLFSILKTKAKNQKMEPILSPLIGEYTVINASIYNQLAVRFLSGKEVAVTLDNIDALL